MSRVMERKVMAMTVAASLLALLALTSQADAQDYPELWADPAIVDGPGSYSFTLTGSGWSPGLLLYVFPCSIPGDQLTTVTPTAEVTARVLAVGDDDCLTTPIGSTAYVGGDGTFSVTVTVDVTANYGLGVGDADSTQSGLVPILFKADSFADVRPGSVHEPAIDALAGLGLFADTLCDGGKFCPQDPIDRATMAVWLIRSLTTEYRDPPAVTASRFADVAAASPAAAFIERLAALEITVGCAIEPLRFCPNKAVNRAQMATFLVRAFDLPSGPVAGFADVAATSVHAANIDALAQAGITVGCDTDPLRYCPRKAVTRAQMATFLARATGTIETPNP